MISVTKQGNTTRYHNNIPFTIIATKGDKLSKNAKQKAKRELANSIGVGVDDVIVTSSLSGEGRDIVEKRLKMLLNTDNPLLDE